MEINSVNNAQSFTGFKITNKTKKGAAQLIEDLASKFENKEKRMEEYMQFQKDTLDNLQKEIIDPLKTVKAEVEYNDGRIFIRNADKTKEVEIDRGKIAPLHPKEYTVVQYPTVGEGENCCVKVNYGTKKAAEKAANNVSYRGPFGDLLYAREIAKHFDAQDAKKLTSETALNTYQRNLDSIADNLLDSLE